MYNWLTILTGIFYIVLGAAVIILKFFIITLEPKAAIALGVLFIVYGIYRIVRSIIKLKNKD